MRLQGRVDEVVNVSGHRLSTIEVESALVGHPLVAEAGAVGVDHPLTGQAVAVFVVPTTRPADGPPQPGAPRPTPSGPSSSPTSRRTIGPVAKPAHVILVPDLPKTRSGKIMRGCSATC